ncbi:MAG TPA: hypothetical protein VM364_06600 [Vicinamibacterales bacterium]|nr:hypothetical protein [Vicinamibacterales bacterium]
MFPQRQHRVRVVQALERTVKQFRTREEIWPLYAPREPVSMDAVIRQALDGASFDPLTLRARTLLWLAWPDGATWELWLTALPSGLKLYCDTGGDETRMLATGRRDSEIETDRLFLELLAESAGQAFGIAMAGGPPSRVRSSLEDRDLLVDFFAALFEEEGLEAEIRREVPASDDFRADVAVWLERALKAR